jgi:hypothetical protein
MSDESDHWTRLGLIFEEALRLDEAARAAFVREAALGDADVEREALSLLASHVEVGAFLEAPLADVGAALLGEPSRGVMAGGTFGPYRILDTLGEGGMGRVLLAEDTRLGRRVALKVLGQAEARSASGRERLRREARAAAMLSHPGIATVFALEEFDGELCLAAEHVEGRTLRDWLDEAERPLGQVLDLAAEIAAALDAAHRGGVVHRDLKPENVMVDRGGHARVLDFGIARVVSAGAADDGLTAQDMAAGTPAYMAPEQLQGEPADFRADIFAFGIVLYEMVAGIHPFQGPTRTSTQARILTASPPPLSRYRAPIPPTLQRIVTSCLQKAPGDRYRDTALLLGDVGAARDALRGHAVAAAASPAGAITEHTPSTREVSVARQWWRAHQALVMATILGMLIASRWVMHWSGGPFAWPAFFVLLVTGVSAGTIRGHLLFVEWSRPAAIHTELARLRRWSRILEVAFAAIACVSALAAGGAHPIAATLYLAAAAIMTMALFAMEPATTRTAFPSTSDRAPGARS